MTVTLSLSHPTDDSSTRRGLLALSSALVKSKRIVVVTGAGISCSSGIPDFRSTDGLYNLVKARYPDVVLKGRDLFDSSLFRDPTSTAIFYSFISELKSTIDKSEPSITHKFIKTLDSKGKLLRSYTQNIDGFEERVGLSSKSKSKGKMKGVRNVLLHGDINSVRCQLCSLEQACSASHLSSFLEGVPPACPQCTSRSLARIASSRRAIKIGTLRPAIVLYDEPHPNGELIGALQTADISKHPDLLVVMGTSLKVHGIKKLVKDFSRAVHESKTKNGLGGGKVIFVNMSSAGAEWNDIIDFHVMGTTDEWVSVVVREWRKMRPADWEVQTTLLDNNQRLKVVKKASSSLHRNARSNFKENLPPQFATPDSRKETPSSPSKRRAAGSHYDTPSSPSKRRDIVRVALPLREVPLNLDSQSVTELEDPFVEAPLQRLLRDDAKNLSSAILDSDTKSEPSGKTNGTKRSIDSDYTLLETNVQ